MSHGPLGGFALPIIVGSLMGALQFPPGDCEVRTNRDAATNDRLSTLTLMLKGPKGPLPINLSITTRYTARGMGRGSPEVRLDFDLPLFVGSLDYKPPHALLVFDKATTDEGSFTASVEPTAYMPGVSHFRISADASVLARFEKATTIEGRLFGVDFVLTPKQVQAVNAFARQELRYGST